MQTHRSCRGVFEGGSLGGESLIGESLCLWEGESLGRVSAVVFEGEVLGESLWRGRVFVVVLKEASLCLWGEVLEKSLCSSLWRGSLGGKSLVRVFVVVFEGEVFGENLCDSFWGEESLVRVFLKVFGRHAQVHLYLHGPHDVGSLR